MDIANFPELEEIQMLLRRRFRRVVLGMIGGGLIATATGLSIFAFSSGGQPAAGFGAVAVVLIGTGILVSGRGVVLATLKR